MSSSHAWLVVSVLDNSQLTKLLITSLSSAICMCKTCFCVWLAVRSNIFLKLRALNTSYVLLELDSHITSSTEHLLLRNIDRTPWCDTRFTPSRNWRHSILISQQIIGTAILTFVDNVLAIIPGLHQRVAHSTTNKQSRARLIHNYRRKSVTASCRSKYPTAPPPASRCPVSAISP